MDLHIRLSTSPHDGWKANLEESSHYCDLYQVQDWRNHPLFHRVPEPFASEALSSGLAGYRVVMMYNEGKDVGLLVCVEDQDEGVMYLGIDLLGRTCREPAANEALWRVANSAEKLAGSSR